MAGQDLSSSSSHDPNQHLDQPFSNVDLRHSAWVEDVTTRSTGGESMRIATVRQLSRALGSVLAECTSNRGEAQQCLAQIEATTKGVNNYTALLNMTVGKILEAPDLDAATVSVVRAWKQLAQENEISTDKLLQGLVATTKKSCEEMLQRLLLNPNGGVSRNQSMDGTIQTIFGVKGDVEHIRIQAIAGHFSSYLAESLKEASAKYKEEKQRVQEAGGDRGPVTEEVAKVSLTLDWRGYILSVRGRGKMKPDFEEFTYKATSADFMGAYLAATLKYAAVAYADRCR